MRVQEALMLKILSEREYGVFSYQIVSMAGLRALQPELPKVCLDEAVYAIAFVASDEAGRRQAVRVLDRIQTGC